MNTENNKSFKPSDYSDVGQAEVLAEKYKDQLRYTPATDYLYYNGSYWEESRSKALAVAQELTALQMDEAEKKLQDAIFYMDMSKMYEKIARVGKCKAFDVLSSEEAEIYREYLMAEEYKKFVVCRRSAKNIAATLQQAQPMLEIDIKQLDADAFLLNTPSYTYNLKEDVTCPHEHDSADYITKQTAVDPSDKGKGIWEDALETFFGKDSDLINYVQEIVGMAAIGKVCMSALIIAYGDGRNGKSTFWNVLARVLGSYSGSISADILTMNCSRNIMPEIAEIKGKRLIIASELDEGLRLNEANVKRLCSTDPINAGKKYKDPFSFIPSHTMVLYTNHLPKVGSLDAGTWRRLIIIPFTAKIEGDKDIKNFDEYLYNEAGGAILSWIIEGAKRAIDHNFKPTMPLVIRDTIDEYREDNDWLKRFIETCCDKDQSFDVPSGMLYSVYRSYCDRVGDYIRSNADFVNALESAGYKRHRSNKGMFIGGIQIKTDLLSQ